MDAVVQATISALGYLENGVYYREPDCFESIRDLICFLRKDTADFVVRRICGERNIIQNDLIPIIKSEDISVELFDITLRLMINLTQPAFALLKGEIPQDNRTWLIYGKLVENLQKCKIAFADVNLFTIFGNKLTTFFESEWEHRNEQARLVIERIITLFRYIFAIPNTEEDSERTEVDINSQDRLITALIESKVDNILIMLGSKPTERDFHLAIVEIFALMLKEHTPSNLISVGKQRCDEQKREEDAELMRVVKMEKNNMELRRRSQPVRHSNFVGSYVVRGIKAINPDNDVIVPRAVKSVERLSWLEDRKPKRRIAKNLRPFEGTDKLHRSAFNVRMHLNDFCRRLLEFGAYNRLMKSARQLANDRREVTMYRHSDISYFQLMRFSMEYRRIADISLSFVSETIGIETFHYVDTQMESYFESICIDKSNAKKYGIPARYAMAAFKELLMTLQWMCQQRQSSVEYEQAESICRHIFYITEYRELTINILRKFKPGILSKAFLRDLIIATHVYVRLMESLSKRGELTKVERKRRKIRRQTKKKTIIDNPTQLSPTMSTIELDAIWNEISDELSDVIKGHIPAITDKSPIDALLDVDDQLHQKFAMVRIQNALRDKCPSIAVGLYRAAREIWPFENTFGESNIDSDRELIELRQIFYTDLSTISKQLSEETAKVYGNNDLKSNIDGELFDNEIDDEMHEYESDKDDCVAIVETVEVSFDFNEYVGRFARADILKWYIFLLKDWKSNTIELNKALIKMLHRIAFDQRLHARLYQLSLFRIFEQIWKYFSTIAIPNDDPFYELYEFGNHLLKQFFANFNSIGPPLICELLFWKGPSECYEIANGYGSYDSYKMNKSEILWPEELDNELRALHDEYSAIEEKPEGMDIVDFIENSLSKTRTRKQLIRQMKSLGLDTYGAKSNKRTTQKRRAPAAKRSKTNVIGADDDDDVDIRISKSPNNNRSPTFIDKDNEDDNEKADDELTAFLLRSNILSNDSEKRKSDQDEMITVLSDNAEDDDDEMFQSSNRGGSSKKKRRIVLSDSE